MLISIDGSEGEGGGQVLRSALALSVCTGKAFQIDRIRARRRRPGLMRQHLTAVEAAAEISGAEVDGAAIGSQKLTFRPGEVVPGEYTFSIGTAGSTTLVLQTVLPPLLLAPGPSRLILEGGTHNPHAPPYDFLEKAFLPLLKRMGPEVRCELESPGFYPAGGGRMRAHIQPVAELRPLEILERGRSKGQRARAVVSALPRHIARRELKIVQRHLNWEPEALVVEEVPNPSGPGNVLLLEVEFENITEVFAAFGERGLRAEDVAEGAVKEARQYLDAEVPVGPYLADQLLLPFSLAGGGTFLTLPPSCHSMTNSTIIQEFLDVEIQVEAGGQESCRIAIQNAE